MKLGLETITIVGMIGVAGCSSAEGGAKPGELGNGGFYFSCDDAVSCLRYSNDAAKFPKSVALGSNFRVRFVSNASTSKQISFDDSSPDRGITVEPVGAFVSRGPNGLTALKVGEATLISRDAAGRLIDFVNVHVSKPDALVVYEAQDVGDSPARVSEIELHKNQRTSYRAFAQEKMAVLAGTLGVEWRTEPEAVLSIDGVTDGTVTVVGRTPGSAKLIATGGTFSTEIPVTVSP